MIQIELEVLEEVVEESSTTISLHHAMGLHHQIALL